MVQFRTNIGGLWKKTNQYGEFLSGVVTLPVGPKKKNVEFNVIVSPPISKLNDSSPDFNVSILSSDLRF